MIVAGEVIFGTILVLSALGAGCAVWESFSEWAARRRRGRRSAAERRMRAASRCTHCGAIGAVEFRRRAGELFHELERSDAGRAVVALADYGRRASHEDRPA